MAAPVNLGLAHPLPERLGADVELAGDPRHLTVTLAGGLHRREHQGDRPLTHLGRVSLGRRVVCCHGSIVSKVWSLHKPPGDSLIH
jgi:hypothetical protein